MEPFCIEENILSKLRIIVVGIGTSGNHVVEYMRNKNIQGLKLIGTNEYEPDRFSVLHEQLKGADIIFLVVGLGGETGTALAPAIAKIAKNTGALTIAIASKPFTFEGRKRREIAENGLKQLQCECDSTIVISNDHLLEIMDPKLKIKESFQAVDAIYTNVIEAILRIVTNNGDNNINLDLDDLKTVISDKGYAVVGLGENQGDNAAYEAMTAAINFPLMQSISLKEASGVIVHFNLHPEYDFMKLSNAMELIYNSIDENADAIFGTTTDERLRNDFVRISIIATSKQKLVKAVNNVEYIQ